MNYKIYTRSVKSADGQHVENEDSYMYSEFSFMKDKAIRLLVVADGMGGLDEGKKASRNGVRGFMKTFYADIMERYMNSDMDGFSMKYAVREIEDCLRRAIQSANSGVCNGAEKYEITGTTISAVCLVDDCVVCANVGDSPVYFYRKEDKKIRLVSKLQTKAEQDVEAGEYKRDSIEYLKNSHILYCSLGEYDKLQEEDIHVTTIGNIKAGDSILVGSDGCFGYMNERMLGRMLNECDKEEEAFMLEQIFALAQMDKKDDQTAIWCIAS